MLGKRLGPYRILSSLGSGATAVVYLAEVVEPTPELPAGTRVALKVIHSHLLEGDSFRLRLRREVEMGMSVRHPNVVRTWGHGTAEVDGEEVQYIAMEYVEGQTLRRLLEEEDACGEALSLHIGREIAAGLSAIHDAGIIHRDVKPENVLITLDEVVKLMDLGMARLKDEAFRLSDPGEFVGTVLYSAPEQFLRGGEDIDGRADLYALGLVLYELVTGRHALGGGEAPGAVMRRQIRTTPTRPGRRNSDLSAFFDELIMKLLRKDRSERFRSAVELHDVLEEGEKSEWWRRAAAARRHRTPRIRIPRETSQYGREPEMESLAALWDRVLAGDGQVVLFDGEAGIGKTRLIDEFAAELLRGAEPVEFLYGAYPPGGAATASGALSTAFREHFGGDALDDALSRHLKSSPDLAPRLAAYLRGEPLPGGGEDAGPTSVDTLQGLFTRLLRSIATDAPVLVCVDDLHFAPPEALSIFAALAHGLASDRVLLVGCFRPSLPEDWLATLERQSHVTRLGLSRLGARDLQLLLSDALLSNESAGQVGGVVAVKSDGNPYFVLEILKSLKEREILTIVPSGIWQRTGKIDDLVIPDSLKDLTRARIAEISETSREFLDVAACCGLSFDPLLVGEVLAQGRIPTLKQFTRIERRHRLVHAAGREFVFDHHQVREALYESLSELLREEYHAAIGEVLIERSGGSTPERTPGPATVEIVTHLLAGRKGDGALPWFRAAIDNLSAAHDFVTLLDIADRALRDPGLLEGEDRVRVLARKGHACQLLGRREEGLATWREGVEVSRGLSELGPGVELLVQYASFHNLLGAYLDALSIAREAVRAAAVLGDPAAAAPAWNISGIVLSNLGLTRAAEAHLRRALAWSREAGDRDMEGSSHAALAKLVSDRQPPEAVREHHEEAIRIFRETRHGLSEVAALGEFAAWLRDRRELEEARERYEEQRRRSRSTGYRRGEIVAELELGTLHASAGRYLDAVRCFERNQRLNSEAGDGPGEAVALVRLAGGRFALGDFASARELGQTALPMFSEAGGRVRTAEALCLLARIAEATGDRDLAAAQYEQAITAFRESDARAPLSGVLALAGRLELAGGDEAVARRRLEESIALSGDDDAGYGALLARALLPRVTGEGVSAATDAFASSADRLDLWQRMDVAWELWTTTGDERFRDTAADLLGHVLEHLPPRARDETVEAVPLYRRVRSVT